MSEERQVAEIVSAIERTHPGLLEEALSALEQHYFLAENLDRAVEVGRLKALLTHVRTDIRPLPGWATETMEDLGV